MSDRPYEDLSVHDLQVAHAKYSSMDDDHFMSSWESFQAMAFYLIDEVDQLRAERDVARLQVLQLSDSLHIYEQRVYELMYALDEAEARNAVLLSQALEPWE